jgi:hypothetical protein
VGAAAVTATTPGSTKEEKSNEEIKPTTLGETSSPASFPSFASSSETAVAKRMISKAGRDLFRRVLVAALPLRVVSAFGRLMSPDEQEVSPPKRS